MVGRLKICSIYNDFLMFKNLGDYMMICLTMRQLFMNFINTEEPSNEKINF